MKATCRNGRTTAGGRVFNANHNTLVETRNQQRHIDHELTLENVVWVRDMNDLDNPSMVKHEGSLDAKKYELGFYQERYGEARDKKNERCVQTRHPERQKTMKQIYDGAKTAPMETLLQIGHKSDHARPEDLEKIVGEFVAWMQKEYGSNLDMLDIALHVDESTPHIHARYVLYGRDKDGYRDVNQAAAFRELKIDRPDMTKKENKYNHPLITFSERNRQKFYDICETYGYTINREVISPSQKHLDVLEYKTERLQEELNRANEKLRKYEQQAQEAQRAERASAERKQKIDQVAELVKREALDFHDQANQVKEQAVKEADSIKAQAQEEAQRITEQAENKRSNAEKDIILSQLEAKQIINMANQTAETKKAAAEVTAAAIVEQAESKAEQIIVNANEAAQEALEAAEMAELDRDKALQEKASTEAQTAFYKQEGERIMREAKAEEARSQERVAEAAKRVEEAKAQYTKFKQQHDDLAASIEEMNQKGYTQYQIDRVKRDMDKARAEAQKDGLFWFGDKKVPVKLETLEGLYTKATRLENLDDYAKKLNEQARANKEDKSFIESQYQKIRDARMELQKREQALAAPEAERAQAIQKEVQKRLEFEMPLIQNRANMYDQAAAERDRFRNEVNEYYAIASQLEVGQGIKLQDVIDAVHETQTPRQNIANMVISAVNQIKHRYEWASQEIKDIVERAKQTWHHHIHRKI